MPIKNIAEFNAATAINNLQYVDPNLTAICEELKKILKACLPPVVTQMNSQFDLKIPAPDVKKIWNAPYDLSESYINSVLVAVNIDTEAQAPRQFVNFSDITIFWIGKKLRTEEQVTEAYQKGAAIRAVMNEFITGYSDQHGRRVWGELIPQPYMWLPEEWSEYSGISVPFRARHDPGHNLWKPLP